MNRNDFIRIIQDTDSVDRQMIGEVRELLDLFPYFQSAHLLLLKGLHNTSDVKFENQLKQSAIFVADREVLYYLLKKEARVMPEMAEIVNPVIPFNNVTQSLLVSEESDEDNSENIVFLLDDESEPAGEKIIYMDPSMVVPATGDLLELDLPNGDSTAANVDSLTTEVSATSDKNSRKQQQSDLIDKFIITNPRIEPVRDKSYPPAEDISKPFTEEKGDFITETLAKIYITQSYYSKAIDIYEKLSLKFPEKSSYFATQIEKVKELIK